MTLLEVLAAFIVLALVTGVAMQAFSGGARVSTLSAESERAIALGESKLALLGVHLDGPGEWEGEWDRYTWHATAADVTPEKFAEASPRVALYRLTVTVAWRERGRTRSHELTTLLARPSFGNMS